MSNFEWLGDAVRDAVFVGSIMVLIAVVIILIATREARKNGRRHKLSRARYKAVREIKVKCSDVPSRKIAFAISIAVLLFIYATSFVFVYEFREKYRLLGLGFYVLVSISLCFHLICLKIDIKSEYNNFYNDCCAYGLAASNISDDDLYQRFYVWAYRSPSGQKFESYNTSAYSMSELFEQYQNEFFYDGRNFQDTQVKGEDVI